MSPVASTRWCPTPEQVMILEEMYRSGVRTPNAAQIQQITAHLSLYGKIEGKNVFYWFQNHKARDRQKLRKRLLFGKQVFQQHQTQQHQQQQHQQQMMMITATSVPPPPPSPPKLAEQHFQPPPPPPHDFLHFDHRQQPPAPPPPRYVPSSLAAAFHHPRAGFSAHQGRREGEATTNRAGGGMSSHSQAWNCGREKARSRQISIFTNDNDWTSTTTNKMSHDHHHPHHHHDHHHDVYDDHAHHHDVYDDHDHDHVYDDDDHVHAVGSTTSTTRPIKTLQLFPINDKISLKQQQQLYTSSTLQAHS